MDEKTAQETHGKARSKASFKISGMTCSSCALTIEKVLSNAKGINEANERAEPDIE